MPATDGWRVVAATTLITTSLFDCIGSPKFVIVYTYDIYYF